MKIRYQFFLLAVSLFLCTPPLFSQDEAGKRAIDRGLTDTHADNITNLNSTADEATPHISPDEGTLYFSSFLTGKDAIYKATRKSVSQWNDPELFLELPGKERISSLTLSKDGNTAIITASNRKDGIDGTSDIYECDIVGGKIENIRSLGATVNSPWWDSQPCVSDDGQMLFFASDRKKGAGGTDIYMSTKTSSGWSAPILLSFCTNGDELSPFISVDNQTLYFASDDLDGGQGGYDIYVTYRTGDNTWSAPKNLGPAVNSSANELFFSIPPVEDALYVASDRSGGLGNFDLYRISPNPVKPKPKSIAFRGQVLDAETGMPVVSEPTTSLGVSGGGETLSNTGSARQYSTMAPIGKRITIQSGADYYQNASLEVQAPSTFSDAGFSEDIKLLPSKVRIVGHVTNVFTAKAVGATVFLEETDKDGKSSTRDINADPAKNGSYFEFDAKPFATYKISTTVADYEPYSSVVPIPPKREALITVEKEIRLQPSTIDAVMVFFDLDKFDLKDEQLSKLTRFIEQVKENPYVKLEALGHTDDQGTEEYNDVLSQRRASAVTDYLLSKGVPKDQVAIVKGFGKSAPLVFGTSDEARAKNRRVEVRIVGKQ